MFNVRSAESDRFASTVLSHVLKKGLDRTVYEILNLGVNDFNLLEYEDRDNGFIRILFSTEVIDKDFLDGVWFACGVWFGNHGLVKAGHSLPVSIEIHMDSDVTETSGEVEVNVRADIFGFHDDFTRISRNGYKGRYD